MRRERLRKIARWAIYLELGSVALFVITLIIGESTHPTMLALYAPRQPLLVAVLAGAIASWWQPKKKILLPMHIAALLIVLFPVMGFSVGFSRSSEKPIRLASYNIFFGKYGRGTILDELEAMKVDIILIQATFDSIPDQLKKRFPDRHVHKDDDLVILTRFPIKTVHDPAWLGEKSENSEQRAPKWVGYELETPNGNFHLYNVHPFSPRHALTGEWSTRDNATFRELQIDAAVENARKNGAPFVIIGDTNLPVMSGIARRRVSGLTDAWSDVGFGFGFTFPAKRPWMRIDRAFCSEGVRFLDIRVGARGASDHLPIFVDFELTR
jgi:endonuclease/exonuclease/phosphatase family metal-dependent hydrolase